MAEPTLPCSRRVPGVAKNSTSAGIVLYRSAESGLEVLIAHPGGPFWAKRDLGAWSFPKGIIEDGETPLEAARREFAEEIGFAPDGEAIELASITQKSGKTVLAWAIEGDFDPADLDSHILEIEYPWRSGRKIRFPEIDRVMWAGPAIAGAKLNPAQVEFVERLLTALDERAGPN